MRAQINLVQCENLSWFGYPDDTVPSVRATLLPGITKVGAPSTSPQPLPWIAIVNGYQQMCSVHDACSAAVRMLGGYAGSCQASDVASHSCVMTLKTSLHMPTGGRNQGRVYGASAPDHPAGRPPRR